jgi:release factor glutamine methyltransferase
VTRLAARGWLRLQRVLLRRRIGRLVLERVGDIPVVVLPDVFNPAVFRTSALLVEAVTANVRRVDRVLDVGAGTGIAAVAAALNGARVRAVDVNAEAVRCTRINALLNGVDDRLDVHHGDLFDAANGDTFDVVICNPPFFRGQPAGARELAWRSADFIDRFAAGLGGVLARDGRALIVFSSHADERGLIERLRDAGFDVAVDRQRGFATEVVTVHRAWRAGASV